MQGDIRLDPRNIPRTDRALVHTTSRYRPIGSYELSLLETPDPDPCPYPQREDRPGLHGYLINTAGGERGPLGSPDYHPGSDLYPVLHEVNMELVRRWKARRKRGAFLETIAADAGVEKQLVAEAINSDRAYLASPKMIKALRGLDVQYGTIQKRLAAFRLMYPGLRTLPEVRDFLWRQVDTFLAICPDVDPPPAPPCPVESCRQRINHAGPHTIAR